MMTLKELMILKITLGEAYDSDEGHHLIPEKYIRDLKKSMRIVDREYRAMKKELKDNEN